MVAMLMEKVNEDNFGEFVDLIVALAEFEHLSPPIGIPSLGSVSMP